MSNFNNIKQEIQYNIADNDSQAITASILRGTLIDMIDATDTNILQSDWDETNPLSNAYIKNKPAAPAGQQQADWNVTDDTSVAYIKHKPTIPTKTSDLINDSYFPVDANYVHTDNNFTNSYMVKLNDIEVGAQKNVQADWTENDPSSDSYIINKPSIPSGQEQADWAENDPNDVSYIKNKPDIPALQKQADWDVTDTSDAAYIKNKPTIPTKTSDLINDSYFPVDANYVHTDNNFTNAYLQKLEGIASGAEVNVQADWDETNTASDAYIKNKPAIPTKTSELTNDSYFPVDANYVHTDNNFTNSYLQKLDGIAAGAEVNVQADWNETNIASDAYINNKPVIPTKTSELTNDSYFPVDANYVHTDNNFTNSYMTKLEGIAAGAEVNVQADWDETNTASDAYINNKPDLNDYVSKTELSNASYVSSSYINNIVKMTTTEYYNIDNPDAYTLYLCN